MSLDCYQNGTTNATDCVPTYSNANSSSLQHLINEVQKICDQELTDYQHIVHSARCNRYFDVMFQLFCEKKQQIGLSTDNRINRFEHHAQIQKIDSKLKEYMGYADISWDEADDEDREGEQIDEKYQALLAEARTDFAQYSQHLQAKSIELNAELMRLLNGQKMFRPITVTDMERCRNEMELKFLDYQNQLKQLTYQNFLLLRSKHFDARRKRRNFSKDATRILSEFFYSHIDHPYPSEDAKVELARRCNITVNQVSNWFGNKRIRTKKSQSRQTETVNTEEASNDKSTLPQQPQQSQNPPLLQQQTINVVNGITNIPLNYVSNVVDATQYYDYQNYDHSTLLPSGEAIFSAYMSY